MRFRQRDVGKCYKLLKKLTGYRSNKKEGKIAEVIENDDGELAISNSQRAETLVKCVRVLQAGLANRFSKLPVSRNPKTGSPPSFQRVSFHI